MNKLKGIFVIVLVILSFYHITSAKHNSYDYSNSVNKPSLPKELNIDQIIMDNLKSVTYEKGISVTDHSYDKQFLYSDGYTSDEAYSACITYMSSLGIKNNSTCKYAYNPADETEIIGFEYKYIGDQNITEEGGN